MKVFLYAALLLSSLSASAEAPQRITLNAGMHVIHAEVMNTQQGRMQGLMHRKSLANNEGMLFFFPERSRHCMWMKNTFLPLSVAFIDDKGVIVNIEDMEPQTENQHCAARPVYFALEMKQGWFGQRGVKAGSVIGGIENAPAPH
jgi:uncharacterized protein